MKFDFNSCWIRLDHKHIIKYFTEDQLNSVEIDLSDFHSPRIHFYASEEDINTNIFSRIIMIRYIFNTGLSRVEIDSQDYSVKFCFREDIKNLEPIFEKAFKEYIENKSIHLDMEYFQELVDDFLLKMDKVMAFL